MSKKNQRTSLRLEAEPKYYCLQPKNLEKDSNGQSPEGTKWNASTPRPKSTSAKPLQGWNRRTSTPINLKEPPNQDWRTRSACLPTDIKEEIALSWRNSSFRKQKENESTWLSKILYSDRNPNQKKSLLFPHFDGYVEDNENGAMVTIFGTICICLNYQIIVDVDLDNTISLRNPTVGCSAVINADGSASALVHCTGRIYQDGNSVEIQTPSGCQGKMCQRGLMFRDNHSAISYLIDEGGVRTTMDKFTCLKSNLSASVFYQNARTGKTLIKEGWKRLQRAKYFENTEGDTTRLINGLQITQSLDGDVVVSSEKGTKSLKTSILRGNVSIELKNMYACASLPPEGHIFVRSGNKRIHASRQGFNVRIGPKSAGLDEFGKLRMY